MEKSAASQELEERDQGTIDRRRMMKRAGLLLGAAALAVPSHAAGQDAATATRDDDDIAGLWEGVVSSPTNAFPSFRTFELYGGGIWIASGQTDLTPAALDSSLWGTFRRIGRREYRTVGRFWTYDPQANPTGFGYFDAIVTVSEDGKTYHGEGPSQFFDNNGNPLGPAAIIADDGTRITFS